MKRPDGDGPQGPPNPGRARDPDGPRDPEGPADAGGPQDRGAPRDDADAREQGIANIFVECLDRINAGESLDLDAILALHPELGPELRAVLESLLSLEGPSLGGTGRGAVAAPRTEGSDIPERIGPYRIVRLVGEGGFGKVYLAEQEEPIRRKVALKVIRAGMDTESVIARFEAERNALALMDHPYVAKVFDAGVTERGRPYFVMEYADGVSITRFSDSHRLNVRRRLELLCQACEAVQHAHQKGIIHRDLKPANVLVSGEDEPKVKVIDFGVAKAIHQRLTERSLFTEKGQIVGTPEYMSPEQADPSGVDIDTRTDIYSLGVLLYELLVGALPFDPADLRRAGLLGIQRVIQEVQPLRPSDRASEAGVRAEDLATSRGTTAAALVRQVRGDLDWITMRAMEKDRDRRYQTASELAADIGRYFRDEAVLAGPPSRAYRLKKFVNRHRGPLGAAVAFLLACLGGLLGMTLLYLDGERERREKTLALEAKAGALERSEGLRLAAEGQLVGDDPALRALLGSEAASHARTAVSEALLESALLDLHEEKTHFVSASWLAFGGHSPDRTRFVTFDGEHRAHVWDAAVPRIIATLRGHTDEIHSAAFDPAGALVVSAAADRTARVWEAATGELVSVHRGHSGEVVSAVFSPDGTLVLSHAWDRTARLWEARSGRLRHALPATLTAGFGAGGSVVLAALDREARLYDVETGAAERIFPPHSREIHELAFSPDGRSFVSASWDSELRGWDVSGESGAPPRWETGMEQWSGFLSGDGQVLVQIFDNSLEAWSIERGERVSVLRGHEGFCYAADFTRDGRYVITGSGDGTARVWEVATGEAIAVLDVHGGEGPLGYSPRFSRDGRYLVTGPGAGTARVWDVARGDAGFVHVPRGGSVSTVRFGPQGDLVLTVTGSEILVWELTGRPIAALRGHRSEVTFADFTRDSRRILSVSRDGTLRVWGVRSRYRWRFLEGRRGYQSMSFDPKASRVLAVMNSEAWHSRPKPLLADLRSRSTTIAHLPEGATAFSPGGERIALEPRWEPCTIYDADTGAVLLTLEGAGMVPSRWCWLPDGSVLIKADRNGSHGDPQNYLKLHDARTGKELTVIRGYTGWQSDCAVSPDGRRVAGGTGKSDAAVWSLATGEKLLALEGHEAVVTRLAFDPSGRWIVTGTSDGVVRVWDAEGGSLLARSDGLGSEVIQVGFSPSGGQVAALTKDGRLELWHDAELARSLTFGSVEEPVAWFALGPKGERLIVGRKSGIEVRPTGMGTRRGAGPGKGSLGATDAATGDFVRSYPGAVGAAFTPDGEYLMLGLPSGEIRRLPFDWRAEAGRAKPRDLTLEETERHEIGSPALRERARRLLEEMSGDPERLEAALRAVDDMPEMLLRAALQEARRRRARRRRARGRRDRDGGLAEARTSGQGMRFRPRERRPCGLTPAAVPMPPP